MPQPLPMDTILDTDPKPLPAAWRVPWLKILYLEVGKKMGLPSDNQTEIIDALETLRRKHLVGIVEDRGELFVRVTDTGNVAALIIKAMTEIPAKGNA